jgi:hypothetical protein
LGKASSTTLALTLALEEEVWVSGTAEEEEEEEEDEAAVATTGHRFLLL